ncbi:hypothetical protein BpHYR1_038910 [Brachionus plicatilis]|uniref:Uncharacterized protein n=1 Tax=Brachionus plicatilis TaxID=10195 RepID=A0A3M7S0N6_BRAPC|nr:hypothetical protein BpHYR1_038910 [Brachionus plicatilis]
MSSILTVYIRCLKYFMGPIIHGVNGHTTNCGYAFIFAGKAGPFKDKMCEIHALSFGPKHVWLSSQLVKEDIIKFSMSFNSNEENDYDFLIDTIKRKPEFKRRFYVNNMDSIEYANEEEPLVIREEKATPGKF